MVDTLRCVFATNQGLLVAIEKRSGGQRCAEWKILRGLVGKWKTKRTAQNDSKCERFSILDTDFRRYGSK